LIPTHQANPEKVCGIRELYPQYKEEDEENEDFYTKIEYIKYEDI